MDYFYVSNRATGSRTGAKPLTTKELKKRSVDMRESDRGGRPVLVKRYAMYQTEEG